MKKSPFKKYRMLTFPEAKACLVRSRFDVQKCSEAILEITGLGYFEAFINGVRLSDNRLMPPKSDYCERNLTKALYPIHDKLSHRIYYYSFDITHLLQPGENILASHIGAGWFGQDECTIEGMGKWGENCLVFKIVLTFSDGTKKEITPDNTVNKWRPSYITKTNIYFGETLDGTKYPGEWKQPGFDDSAWDTPESTALFDSVFTLADCPPDRVTSVVSPVLIHEKDGVRVYELPSTLAGTPVIKFNPDAQPGSTASVYFADKLNDDMTPDFHSTGGKNRLQHDIFVFSPSYPEEYRLHFTWNAGRYIVVEGSAHLKAFEEIRTDIKQRVFFKCENEVLQWYFDAYARTQEANIHGCVPSDCPHRERLGYTGDGQLCSAAAMYIFDASEMYRKWLHDIRDCQNTENGHIQHTAPFYGGGGGPGGWGGAAVIVPWNFYRFYADKEELSAAFDSMTAYLRYMKSRSDSFLVTREEEGGWCLGDWCTPKNDIKIPESFVNTFYFAECARLAAKAAEILGKTEFLKELNEAENGAKKALKDNFYDNETGSFCAGVQGADAFAVHLGIGSEKTAHNLVEKYSSLREFDTGIFGTYYLIESLFELGENELAVELLSNKKENSFYNMMKHGSANLWENWDGCDSLCHPMFGASAEFIVSKILGINESFFNKSEKPRAVSPVYAPSTGNIDALIKTADGDFRLKITYDENKKQNISLSCKVES